MPTILLPVLLLSSKSLNLFVPNAPFLDPLKTLENREASDVLIVIRCDIFINDQT